MEGETVRGCMVAVAHVLGQAQQALEHGRHPLRMGDTLGHHRVQRSLGVELLQADRAATRRRYGQHGTQRRGVVQRAGEQVARAGIELENRHQVGRKSRWPRIGRVWQRAPYALGEACGARGVEHQGTRAFLVAGVARMARHGLLHWCKAGQVGAMRQPVRLATHQRRQLPYVGFGRLVGDHQPGLAITQDIGDVGCGKRG